MNRKQILDMWNLTGVINLQLFSNLNFLIFLLQFLTKKEYFFSIMPINCKISFGLLDLQYIPSLPLLIIFFISPLLV